VLVCHVPPGNPDNAHTICISPNAVPAHLAHGDYLGPCNNGKSGIDAEEIFEEFDVNVYPNPVGSNCEIEILQESASYVTVEIYDLLGREVSKIYEGELIGGRHLFTWAPPAHGASLYFLLVQASGEVKTIKLMTK
jgi:hypothetical protein